MRALALALAMGVLYGCGGGPGSKVTLTNFKKIVSGMTGEEITTIMGPPARIEEGKPSADGKKASVYHWKGSDGYEYSAWLKDNIVGPTQWREPTGAN